MPIRFERPADHPGVALVTIDRPEAANSLDPEALAALAATWREIAADDSVQVVVVTGAGDRVWCSGMDLKRTIPASQRLAKGDRVSDLEFEGLRSVSTATLAGFAIGKPMIAAVNGHARGGGFDFMLATDIRYAVPAATFALEEVALGLYPTGHATVLLPRQIAWVHASEILYAARPFSAGKALEIGLINEIVEPEQLLDRAFETADRIASNAPLAVRATWRGVRELMHLDLDAAYERQEQLGKPLRRTEDAREAQRAFVEKRKPSFKGH
jgi:enoyl-CoA hydratase/carnithine racemase